MSERWGCRSTSAGHAPAGRIGIDCTKSDRRQKNNSRFNGILERSLEKPYPSGHGQDVLVHAGAVIGAAPAQGAPVRLSPAGPTAPVGSAAGGAPLVIQAVNATAEPLRQWARRRRASDATRVPHALIGRATGSAPVTGNSTKTLVGPGREIVHDAPQDVPARLPGRHASDKSRRFPGGPCLHHPARTGVSARLRGGFPTLTKQKL